MLTRGNDIATVDFEYDDGFVFTRKSKKAKTELVAPRVRRSPRHRPEAAAATTTRTTAQSAARKVAASPSRDAERKRREASIGRASQGRKMGVTRTTNNGSRRDDGATGDRSRSNFQSPPRDTTIALPTNDTTLIARNKEMRTKAAEALPSSSKDSNNNNHRLSSSGTRGRWASSLIEKWQTATAHCDLNSRDFYKHIIAEGMPEPLRMKQLLMWCSERALPKKPKQDVPSTTTALYARGVLDDLSRDFSTRPEFSNWLGRDESVVPPTTVLKPNPKNIELNKKRASLEARIQRLQEEKNAWQCIQKLPPNEPQQLLNDTITSYKIQLPLFELLDAEEGCIHKYLAAELEPPASVSARTTGRLQAVQRTLEFNVDQLADNVHKLQQRVAVASRQADVVLRRVAERLKKREDEEKRRAGTKEMPMMEVLWSLGVLLPEGGGHGI